MGFYERVTALRKERGLSQKQVQEELNLNKNSFGNWKSGVIPVYSTQKALADYFGVSVQYLSGVTEEEAQTYDSNDNHSVFYERITNLTLEKGLTRKTVLSDCGLSPNTFTGWKNGKIPQTTTLTILANYFGVSVEYLRGETDERKPVIDLNKAGFETFPYVETPVRPIYGTVSAGTGVIADQIVLGYERVEPQYANDRYFWLSVKGDSMSPVFTDGDLLLIQHTDTLESGTIAAVLIDNEEGLVKQVLTSKDTVTLLSYNPAYPPRVFSGQDASRVKPVGRVIEQRRKFLQ